MTPSVRRSIPEELLLLCADPVRGRLRIPAGSFHRVIAGGVVAELVLTGAVTVEDRRITGFQPLGGHDEVAAGVLARLEAAGKSRHRLGLEHVVRRIPRKPGAAPFLDRLTAAGLLTVEQRRFLGLPYRLHVATPPGIGQEIAARVAATLAREGGAAVGGAAADPSPVSRAALPPAERAAAERDRQLAGLIGAARLQRRLYPGAAGAPTRQAVRRLVRELPVARAVQRVIASDSAGDGG
ncbi:GPP34 family phosphoprotein [Kitasatospora sp. NPDC047058]|uniref:GOLPH3/VPS74 family protein n=1 Tax=Kitasatospora sp. NPDC047058 TaxID=3155620 RepID=UPI00340EAF24